MAASSGMPTFYFCRNGFGASPNFKPDKITQQQSWMIKIRFGTLARKPERRTWHHLDAEWGSQGDPLFVPGPPCSKGTNPRELVAAAHAGCFTMALSLFWATPGITPSRSTRVRK